MRCCGPRAWLPGVLAMARRAIDAAGSALGARPVGVASGRRLSRAISARFYDLAVLRQGRHQIWVALSGPAPMRSSAVDSMGGAGSFFCLLLLDVRCNYEESK